MDLSGVAKKIAQARHFLGRAQAENEKPGQAFAVEADLMAFLSMAQAAFYRLRREIDEAAFERKRGEWWEDLNPEEQKLLTKLIGERHLDVHKADPETTVKERKVPFRPKWPYEFSWGEAWTFTQEVHLQAADIPGCYKALDLFENFVSRFEEGDRREPKGE